MIYLNRWIYYVESNIQFEIQSHCKNELHTYPIVKNNKELYNINTVRVKLLKRR